MFNTLIEFGIPRIINQEIDHHNQDKQHGYGEDLINGQPKMDQVIAQQVKGPETIITMAIIITMATIIIITIMVIMVITITTVDLDQLFYVVVIEPKHVLLVHKETVQLGVTEIVNGKIMAVLKKDQLFCVVAIEQNHVQLAHKETARLGAMEIVNGRIIIVSKKDLKIQILVIY